MRMAAAPIASSRNAYTRSGCRRTGTSRGNSKLPAHRPPMNVPSTTAREAAVAPRINSSSWNQTIS